VVKAWVYVEKISFSLFNKLMGFKIDIVCFIVSLFHGVCFVFFKF
jgi:hypothetical protein